MFITGFVIVFVPKTYAKTDMHILFVTTGFARGYKYLAPMGLKDELILK